MFVCADNTLKLGDFGLARSLERREDLVLSRAGSPFYLSPEMCTNLPYGSPSDIWGVGCVLYEMVCLSKAFYADNMRAVVERICAASYTPPAAGACSEGVLELLHSILQVLPEHRPSAEQLLNHPVVHPTARRLEPHMPLAAMSRRRAPLAS